MTGAELRRAYVEFFKGKGHVEIGSAPLVPENDPTVLFTTAGMHPLVPFLLGEKHPAGKRLVNCQKCVRTGDIDEVGDAVHHTFFEMLGNWSLGDYFKEEAIAWSYEFLTGRDWLDIDPARLWVTCFAGDPDAPRDTEAAAIWERVGIPAERIIYLPKKDNWWGPAGQTGPCGPDTEMFYCTYPAQSGVPAGKNPGNDSAHFIEIWNDVFMQYNKNADGAYSPLAQKNVDTGLGLERVTAVLQGKDDNYATELFAPIMERIAELSSETDVRSKRIIADHMRSAVFMIGDGVRPARVDQGYVLRRLIRRAVRFGKKLGIGDVFTYKVGEVVVESFGDVYPELKRNACEIRETLVREEEQFGKTLAQGLKEFEKLLPNLLKNPNKEMSGRLAFRLYDTYGFPIEMTRDLAEEAGMTVDMAGFEAAYEKHQELSRQGAEQKFSGGLADNSEVVTRLHTATHLLQAALRRVLGDHVAQRGSNITAERLRFDFAHPDKMTPEQIAEVERLVNEQIQKKLDVTIEEMPVEQAKASGAMAVFGEKYGDTVKVYSVGGFSKEICGGPHVANTGELGRFRITKEQSSSAGIRRIRAVLE
ncbi:MAG: alanine--tRNA ligase [Verrucomicrobia bacterium]|nr:alanine--tRNA ligase [Verrucomicrobiota bacterium]